MESIEELAARAAAGDGNAAADFVRQFWPDAYRIAFATLHNREAAQDTAQEACARAWSGFSRLRDTSRARVWFYRIVANESKRTAQRSARDRFSALDAATEKNFITVDVAHESGERVDLRAAIASLDESLRLTILLRYYFDLTNAEAARVLGILPVTVRWRLMVAHRRLREILLARDVSPSLLTSSRRFLSP